MAIESDSDRDTFLGIDEFGVSVTINAVSFNAIKDQAFEEVALGAAGIAGTRPLIIARDSDVALASAVVGSTVTIDAVNYTIVELEPDGTGMTTIILDKQ